MRRVGMPRRHLARDDLVANRAGPWPRVLKRHQRHRRDFTRPVTGDAFAVEDRRDVFAECRRVLGRRHTRVLRGGAEHKRHGHQGSDSNYAHLVLLFLLALARHHIPMRTAYLTPNASSTFPARPPNAPYPEFTNIIPPAIAGPGPIIDAPCAGMPLTVVKSRFESNSQSTVPF